MTAPAFDLRLTPFQQDGDWAGIDVFYRAEIPLVPAGEPLLSLPKVAASVPGAPYATSEIHASDAHGSLSLTETEGPTGPMRTDRHWVADREVAGAIEVSVRAPVRDVDVRTPVGPLFDLRREQLGLFGAGETILPLPVTDDLVFRHTLTWILDPGVTAVSSRGTGDRPRTWEGPVQDLRRCLLGAGTPHVEPVGDETFGIHAYSDVPFDLTALSAYLRDIHAVMTAFFEEPDGHYHVLVRRNPDKGSGGTSFPSSFAFGYSPTTPTDEDDLRSLLAHEMVHNWPTLSEGWEESSWYSEGTAELYSLVLPWRAGILPTETMAEQLSGMYRRYDANPRRGLSYPEAAEIFWEDLRAQTVPYGRGLRYLVHVDTQLHGATAGRVSLDDIVLDILRAQRAGHAVGVDGWLERIREHLGDGVRAEYRAMVDGEPVPWPTAPFQGALTPVRTTAPEHDLGFDIGSFQRDPRLVTGLVPGSAAERAGLREGDELLTRRFSYSAARDGSTPLELAIRRDGDERTIRYEPRGADVPTIGWEPVPSGAPAHGHNNGGS